MLLYNLVVRLYGLLIRLASVKQEKAKQWVSGRSDWRNTLGANTSKLKGARRIWVHCASYGEFEQGRPLIEAIRAKNPTYSIVLSFFSPSGYEPFKAWAGADVICYLPLDTKRNARDFIDIVKPDAAIFIKYEFWVNFLFMLRQKNIPTFLVSAVFKSHHPFFKWYGGLFRRSLKTFSRLFIQDEESGRLLQSIGIANYEVCGDTRFDRVLTIKESFKPLPFFEEACRGKTVVVAGSTWPGDEEILLKALKELNNPSLLLVLAPHNVDEKSIAALEQRLTKSGTPYSLYSKQQPGQGRPVLVVDAMGLLSKLYHYGSVAYIGGGFDSGIHNVLEPAVYFIPVLFHGGNDYHKYNEAVAMLKDGTARNVENATDLKATLEQLLNNEALRRQTSEKLQAFFAKNSGTTEKVLALIGWD